MMILIMNVFLFLGECSYLVSVICLLYMLPESRVKPNHENIVWAVTVSFVQFYMCDNYCFCNYL